MTHPIDLRPDHLEIVQGILCAHLSGDVKVWVFGSRANWTTKDSSDLDLALESESRLSHKLLGALKDAFEDSSLPYTVDIVDLNRIGDTFRQIVESQRVPMPMPGDETTPRVRPAFLPDSRAANLGSAIPVDAGPWREVMLSECTVVNDATYSPNEGWAVINYLDTGSITENRISKMQQLELGKDTIPSRARRKVQPGDIVYSTVRPNQKHFGMLKSVPSNCLVSTGFAVLRGRKGLADTDFIYYFLAQNHIVEYLHTVAENSTSAYPSIKPSDLGQLIVSLPPLAQQRAIAHVLGTLDDKIALNRQMNQILEAMAWAIFQDWFVDFGPVRAKIEGREPYLPPKLWDLFPDRLTDSELGEIPEGWSVSCFGELAEVVGGSTPRTSEPAYWENGTYPFATPKDLSSLSVPVLLDTQRQITDAGLARISSRLLPVGTVLMSSRAPIGYLAIAEIPVAVNQGFIAMKPKPGMPSLFLLYCAKFSQDEIRNRANGTTFLEISKVNFRPIPIIMPNEATMVAFDTMTRSLIDRIIVNCREVCELKASRDSLLPKLVNGKLQELSVSSRCAEKE